MFVLLGIDHTGLVDPYSYGVTAFPKVISHIISLGISGKLIAAN